LRRRKEGGKKSNLDAKSLKSPRRAGHYERAGGRFSVWKKIFGRDEKAARKIKEPSGGGPEEG